MSEVMLYLETFPEQLEAMERTGKWTSQQKADGDNFKAVVGSEIKLINRHDNDYTRQFPEIVAGLGLKNGVKAILNGEIAYWDGKKFDFNLFRGRQGLQKDKDIQWRMLLYPCKIYVFDLIEYNGISMLNNPDYPFERRYEILKEIVINNDVTQLLPVRKDLLNHFKEECEGKREGIVVKFLGNVYCGGRTKSVLKCKNWKYSPINFTKFEDNKAGITCENEGGDRVLVAGKNAGLVRDTIIQQGHALLKIRYLIERTENGRLREPSFKGLEG